MTQSCYKYDSEHHTNAYDTDINLFEGVRLGFPNDNKRDIEKHDAVGEMLEVAKSLTRDSRHARIDLYYTNGIDVFVELTFTKCVGFGRIQPVYFR